MNPGWLFQEIGRAVGESIRDTFNRQYGPGEGMCPDWLAYSLGIAAAMTLILTIISAIMYNF